MMHFDVTALKLYVHDGGLPQAVAMHSITGWRDLTRREQWRLTVTVFAFIGDQCHFNYRTMKEWTGITRKPWERMCDLLDEAGVIARAPKSKTQWRGPWNYKRFRRYIKFELLALPYPIDCDPPPLRFSERVGNTDDTVRRGAQMLH